MALIWLADLRSKLDDLLKLKGEMPQYLPASDGIQLTYDVTELVHEVSRGVESLQGRIGLDMEHFLTPVPPPSAANTFLTLTSLATLFWQSSNQTSTPYTPLVPNVVYAIQGSTATWATAAGVGPVMQLDRGIYSINIHAKLNNAEDVVCGMLEVYSNASGPYHNVIPLGRRCIIDLERNEGSGSENYFDAASLVQLTTDGSWYGVGLAVLHGGDHLLSVGLLQVTVNKLSNAVVTFPPI